MALESTNGWSIRNYRSVPYYDIPFAMYIEAPTEIPKSNLNAVSFDLYDGTTFKCKVAYLEPNDLGVDEAEVLKQAEITKAKDKYLRDKYL